MADENGKDLVDEGSEMANDAADSVNDASESVSEKAGDAVESIKETAGDAADKAGEVVDSVKDAAGDAVEKGKEMAGDAADAVGDMAGSAAGAVTGAAGAASDKVGDALGGATDAFDGDGDSNSVLKWLLPLLLLGLILVLGFMFCSPNKDGGTTTGTDNTNTESNTGDPTADAVNSSVSVTAKDGKYAIAGVVKDEETKANIKKEAEAVWGEGNVDVEGLQVDANAGDFREGWWDGFKGLLPELKDWKDGSISWADGAIETVGDIPASVGAKIKSLFSGWGLPVSIAGAEDAAKAANEKALEMLEGADTVEKVVEGLNASIINFASGKSDVPEDAKPILAKAAEVLKNQEQGTVVEIGGHTDNTGNADANMKLSTERAESVMKALVALGVSDKMLTAKGYGQTSPKASNDTDDGKFQNRRIEYKVGGSTDAPSTDGTEPAADSVKDSAKPNADAPAPTEKEGGEPATE